MEDVIKKGIGGPISTYFYDAETAATLSQLSSTTVSAWTPSGSELIANTAITPAADGKMTLSVSAANAANVYNYCLARFYFTYDSQARTKDVYFHIAQTDFDIPFHYPDLVKFQTDIGDYAFSGDDKFANQRDSALWELYSELVNANRMPWKIISRGNLRVPFARLWFAHIYEALSNRPGDEWSERAQFSREQFKMAFQAANIVEVEDDSAHRAGMEAKPIGSGKLRRG